MAVQQRQIIDKSSGKSAFHTPILRIPLSSSFIWHAQSWHLRPQSLLNVPPAATSLQLLFLMSQASGTLFSYFDLFDAAVVSFKCPRGDTC